MGVLSPFRFYSQTVGARPLLETGLLGLAGGATSYLAAPLVARKLIRGAMAGMPLERQNQLLKEMEDAGTFRKIQTIATVFGGGMGALYALNKHWDPSAGAVGRFEALIDPANYWRNPENRARWETWRKGKEEEDSVYSPTPFVSNRPPKSPFGKIGADLEEVIHSWDDTYSDIFFHKNIPVNRTTNLINQDEYLTYPQKNYATRIVQQSGTGESGMVSGKDVATAAIHVGVGLTAGYLFGKTLGAILAAPEAVTKRLSHIGAVAGGIINSGIFK
jgi:hypothetical protein